jgi:transcriptional regulator with XRE-family HTH domain
MSIGERISTLRKQHKISQLQLSRIMDVSRQAVSKWENDLSAPDTLRLIQLAEVLDTSVEFLATGSPPPKPKAEVIRVVETVDRIVEKVVVKPITIEKVVEVEKKTPENIESVSAKKVIRRIYVRNPVEFIVTGLLGVLLGIIIGVLIK